MSSKTRRPLKREGLVLVGLVLVSICGGFVWLSAPVRTRVFSMNCPNADLGVLELNIIGDLDFTLDAVSIGGFFKVGNDTITYRLDIEDADVEYFAEERLGFLYQHYLIKYHALKLVIPTATTKIYLDYFEVSGRGEVEIVPHGNRVITVSVFQRVPRGKKESAQWPTVKFNQDIRRVIP